MIKKILTTVILLSTIFIWIVIEINIGINKIENKNIYKRYVDINSRNDLINTYSNLLK